MRKKWTSKQLYCHGTGLHSVPDLPGAMLSPTLNESSTLVQLAVQSLLESNSLLSKTKKYLELYVQTSDQCAAVCMPQLQANSTIIYGTSDPRSRRSIVFILLSYILLIHAFIHFCRFCECHPAQYTFTAFKAADKNR